MIPLLVGRPMFVAVEPVDLRRSFDGLAQHALAVLGMQIRQGAVVLFPNRGRDRLKILFHDRTGYVIVYKRLDRGRFPMPHAEAPGAPSVRIDPRQFALLFDGLQHDTGLAPSPSR